MLLLTKSARGVNDVEGPETASAGVEVVAETDADMLLIGYMKDVCRVYKCRVCRVRDQEGEYEMSN